jgi:SAM-dependent methyltransferase
LETVAMTRYTEPYVPVPEDVIPKMLALASVKPGELVYDLGSGDGRIAIAAARDFHARAVGVEIRKRLVAESRERVKELGLSRLVTITHGTFMKADLRKTDVVATYLTGYVLNRLDPKFIEELRPGARIVNFDYEVPGRTAVEEIDIKPAGWKKSHPVYLYRVE